MAKRIARVFPRKTQYTPTDDLVFFDGPGLFSPEVDEVHVSVCFSWDKPKAEWLAEEWSDVAPVKIGGPAYGNAGGGGDDFTPGMYLREGYTFSSRGCIRNCPFCLVPCQEGKLRELAVIHPGHVLMDNNVLACSRPHIEKVFDMLEEEKAVMLLGGLDCRLMRAWHVARIAKLKLRCLAIAYDMEGQEKDLARALDLLHAGGIPHGKIWCFVLGGFFPDDTPDKAEQRAKLVLELGGTPYSMVYRDLNDSSGKKKREWAVWATHWSCQRVVYARAKEFGYPTYQEKMKREREKAKDN